MFQSHRLCLALASCFLFMGGSIAQANQGTGQGTSHSSDAGAGLIQLDVVVTDASGRPTPGLQSSDFKLLENGEPNKILSFQAFDVSSGRPDPPVEVILVIDILQLPGNLISNELNSVDAFLRRNGGRLAEPVSIFTVLETGLWQVADGSRDGNALASQVAHTTAFRLIRRFRGSAGGDLPGSMGLTDPPSLNGLESLGEIAIAERRKPGRKLLLWIGPGWGIGSGAFDEGRGAKGDTLNTICWFSTVLREARIALYNSSVGEMNPSEGYLSYVHGVDSVKKANFLYLNRKVLAVQSGGRVLNRSYDLVSEMESCVREARVFYRLSFDPSGADHADEYHELKVQIDRQGLTARTNTGYYDQPFYTDQADPSLKRVTIAQLEQIVEEAHGGGDAEVANQLSALELTERLNGAKLVSLTASAHGKKTGQALTQLANASAFLPPPATETPPEPPPDVDAQQRVIALAANYVQQTITKLPNFFADRTTAHYQETAIFDAANRRVEHEPMHLTQSFKETVLYRDGSEVADPGSGKRKKRNARDPYLITYGTFGPALGFVHDVIAAPGALTWSRWEQGAGGPLAVFGYTIPAAKSLYSVSGCCLPDGDGTATFERLTGYRGEISIDPSTGAILRLQAEADIQRFPPISRSDITISYGPVEIGGKTFICPLRSVSIMRTRSLTLMYEWDESFLTYGPYATLVNDIAYGGYHMFHASSRVMPGFNPEGDGNGQR